MRRSADRLKDHICKRDILLGIYVKNTAETLQKLHSFNEEYLWAFQFKIYLEYFIPQETPRYWSKQHNYENLFTSLNQLGILRYPKSIELLFTIPHNPQYVASSSVYEEVLGFRLEDVRCKNCPLIMNTSGEVDKFQKEKNCFIKREKLVISLTLLVEILTLVFGVINVFSISTSSIIIMVLILIMIFFLFLNSQ